MTDGMAAEWEERLPVGRLAASGQHVLSHPHLAIRRIVRCGLLQLTTANGATLSVGDDSPLDGSFMKITFSVLPWLSHYLYYCLMDRKCDFFPLPCISVKNTSGHGALVEVHTLAPSVGACLQFLEPSDEPACSAHLDRGETRGHQPEQYSSSHYEVWSVGLEVLEVP